VRAGQGLSAVEVEAWSAPKALRLLQGEVLPSGKARQHRLRHLRRGHVLGTDRRRGTVMTATSRTTCERPATGFPLVAGRFGVCGGCWVRTNVG
jgi:hypothetical protein